MAFTIGQRVTFVDKAGDRLFGPIVEIDKSEGFEGFLVVECDIPRWDAKKVRCLVKPNGVNLESEYSVLEDIAPILEEIEMLHIKLKSIIKNEIHKNS